MKPVKKKIEHETHYACDEQFKKYGRKTIGCCCTSHVCKAAQPLDCIHGKNPEGCNWCQQINKHSCTAEIIAELERLDDQWRAMYRTRLSSKGIPAIPADLITDRIKELKAKETQL